jgi:hypothetical protein
MPRLTEAEYDALEDEITHNPPDADPAKSRRPVRAASPEHCGTRILR